MRKWKIIIEVEILVNHPVTIHFKSTKIKRHYIEKTCHFNFFSTSYSLNPVKNVNFKDNTKYSIRLDLEWSILNDVIGIIRSYKTTITKPLRPLSQNSGNHIIHIKLAFSSLNHGYILRYNYRPNLALVINFQ